MKNNYLISLLISLVILSTSSSIYSQQPIFEQDFLNLVDAENNPFLFKAYSQIEIDKTWDLLNNIGPNLTSVKVGIIDTGVDISNPEFKNVLLNALSPELFKDGKTGGHGTQVAGIIGANNISFPNPNNYTSPQMNGILSGVHDLNYGLELGKKSSIQLTFYSLASAIDNLSKRGVKIINMSFANPIPILSLKEFPLFFKIFSKKSDVLFIVPAGQLIVFDYELPAVDAELIIPSNFGDNFDNVITVGATDITPGLEDQRISYSNFGSAVNISAPGMAVYSPAPRGKGNFPPDGPKDYDRLFSGTSASVPMVTGVAAILKALEPEYQKYTPGLQMIPAKIKEILQKSADPIVTDEPLGSGCFDPNNNPQGFNGCRLNAYRAVAWLFPPTPVILEKPEVIPK